MAKVATGVTPLEFAKALLEKNAVQAVMGTRLLGSGGFTALLTSPDQLEGFDPLFPVMPSNAARSVSRLTEEPLSEKVAVFLRPCELRALFELVKLNQAHLDNLLLVGIECAGVLRNEEVFVQRQAESLYGAYLDACKKGELVDGVREVCRACECMFPETADVVISVIGREEPVLVALTEKGEDLLSSLGFSLSEGDARTEASLKLEEERRAYADRLCQEVKEEAKGIDGLLEVFGRCIGCHNCSHVCPICYCKDCFFESATFDYEPESYENRLNKKGTFRVPLDTILFHLGRMTHMATSCVACGMCEDACPMGIPVARVFKAVGRDVQALFEYVPGRSLEEALPLTTFRYDELHEVEDK